MCNDELQRSFIILTNLEKNGMSL